MGSNWDSIKDSSKSHDFWSISKDKSINERGTVWTLLESLSVDASTLVSTGFDDPPDCTLEVDGEVLGIEVVALIDQGARELSAEARSANKKLSQNQQKPEFYANWSMASFRAGLAKLVVEKEAKILLGKKNFKSASLCGSFWLVVHTDEFTLSSSSVQDFVSDWNLESGVFERIYLILFYEPGRTGTGYPYFKLK